MKLISPAILTLCVLLTAAVLLTPSLPLGVVGVNSDGAPAMEWVWQRHRFFEDPGDAIERLLPAVIGGLVLFATATLGAGSLRTAGRLKRLLLFAVLIVASLFWVNRVQQTAPVEHREAKPYWVVYDPSSSGYFFEAAFRMDSVAEFLGGYEARMQQGEVLHVGTHPPGLFLLCRGCLDACERSPKLTSFLTQTQNRQVRKAFRVLEREARFAGSLTTTQLAALQLVSDISGLAIALTIIPIAILCHVFFDRMTAWRICCLWATLPCLAVFAPKSDVLFPLTCTSVLALAVVAMAGRSKASSVWAIPAGAVLWLGMMMSLAHVPAIALLCACLAIRAYQSKGQTIIRDSIVLLLMLATVFCLSLWWSDVTECNILTVWRLNLTNHAAFYDQFPRTWWKWLLVNPIELAFAVGLPLVLAAISGVGRSLTELFKPQSNMLRDPLVTAFCLAAAFTVSALWLSGKNQGEAARLWCFLTPWLLIMAGRLLCASPAATMAANNPDACWRHLLLAQLAVATITISQVSGFSF